MARCCRTTLAWMIRKSAIDFRGRDQAQQKYTTTAWFVDCPRTEICIGALEHLFYKLGKKDYLGALFTAAPKSTPYIEVWSSATDGHTAESVYKERDAPAGLFSSLRHRGGPRGATNNSAKVARENL